MTEPLPIHGLDSWDPEPFLKILENVGYLADESFQSDSAGKDESDFSVLYRLFLLGEPVLRDIAEGILGEELGKLIELGVLSAGDPKIRANFQLCPLDGEIIASDFPARQLEPSGDYVMSIAASSRQLAALVPSRPPCRVLELCCGVAWLARQLAKAGHEVTATDVNPRALDLGRLNARLNGSDPIEWRMGNLFRGLDGEEFELIVSNPPFVQSPGGNMLYRETPAGAKGVCQSLVADLLAHLSPGGVAIVLLNWCHTEEDNWADPPLAWLPRKPRRAWLFQNECLTPADYAWRWIQGDPRFASPAAAVAEWRRWQEYFATNGIHYVSTGFLVLQKPETRDAPVWTRLDSRNIESLPLSAGGDVARVLRNETWLHGEGSDLDFLDVPFQVPDGIRSEIVMQLEDGWDTASIQILSPDELAFDGEVDNNTLRLLELCRNGETPRALLDELQSAAGFADLPDLASDVAELAKVLLQHGLLEPPTD